MPVLIGAPMPSLFAQQGESQETAEMFQVSRVGARGAAETRELLGLIYRDVATNYDTNLREEVARNNGGQEFKGERIRVIRKLTKNNPNGDLFLCAYAGKPSVVKISGTISKVENLPLPSPISPRLANTSPKSHERWSIPLRRWVQNQPSRK